MNMPTMPTNDVFLHLIILLRLHKNNGLITDIFKAQGIDVTNSKIKSWSTKSGKKQEEFRAMPRPALDAFISELHNRKLVQEDA